MKNSGERFRVRDYDPSCRSEDAAIARLEATAWQAHVDQRKSRHRPVGGLDRDIGYFGPYFDSHDALDADEAVQEEARNVARAVVEAVALLRRGEPPARPQAESPAAEVMPSPGC